VPFALQRRAAIAVAIGTVAALLVFLAFRDSTGNGDFWRPFMGAQALLERTTPYSWFGGSRFPNEFPDLYPLVASVPLVPLAWFPFPIAAAIWSGFSAGVLAFALTRDGYHRLVGFLSLPLIVAIHGGQYVVLMTAAFLIPSLSFFYAAKPTVGVSLLIARASKKAFIAAAVGGIVLFLISFVLSPSWAMEWIQVVRNNSGHMKPPLLQPGGFIALSALLKWRRPEARLIVLLSLVPQNIAWYDSVPLLIIPSSLTESVVQSFMISIPAIREILTHGGSDGVIDFWPRGFELALFAYLPALAMVLRRPNVSEAKGGNLNA
jgi:hypothetical protein